MKVSRLAGLACVALALVTSSCQSATSSNDLPLEEWVVTKAYVAFANGSSLPYDDQIEISYSDSNSHSGSFTDDYDGKVGTDALAIFKVSSYTISAADLSGVTLTTIPNPSSNPVFTFDTNHYFYRRGNGYSVGEALAKCHFKTASITVTFQQ